jgi:hypothetical protein
MPQGVAGQVLQAAGVALGPSVAWGNLLLVCSWMAGDEAAPTGGEWRDLKLSNHKSYRHALALDPATGDLFWSRWGQGVGVSRDQGKTFARADGEKVGGNPFSASAVVAAPDGGKVAVFSSQAKALAGRFRYHHR